MPENEQQSIFAVIHCSQEDNRITLGMLNAIRQFRLLPKISFIAAAGGGGWTTNFDFKPTFGFARSRAQHV